MSLDITLQAQAQAQVNVLFSIPKEIYIVMVGRMHKGITRRYFNLVHIALCIFNTELRLCVLYLW